MTGIRPGSAPSEAAMSLFSIENRESFAFSAENPTGTRNGGTRGGDCEKLSPCVGIRPGETRTLVDTDGPGMITHIWFTGYVGHSFILRIYWDGADFPSVEAPISAFFGSAYDENFETTAGHYSILNSAFVLVAPGRGLNSYFEMPFRSHCRITIENRGGREETLYYMISGWRGAIPENAGYFHARFRRSNPLPYKEVHTILEGVEGRGQYVGTYLFWGVNNNNWWGEGEIKFYMDGDRDFPTICGTGTEDYFCGAYNFDNEHAYERFATPYSGMIPYKPDGLYDSNQRFSLYRWHLTDPVRFSEDLKVTIQALGWRSGGRYLPLQDDISSVAYFYLDHPAEEISPLPSRDELEII